jgi:predicted metalloprotease
MKWTPGYKSDDVIDERGEGGARQAGFGGGGGGLGILLSLLLRTRYGWVAVLAFVGYSFVRGSFGPSATQRASGQNSGQHAPSTTQTQFVGFVLDDVQKTWEQELAPGPVPYRHAKLVLFTDSTTTGCGYGDAATGPFYCPNDERVYIDLGFFNELSQRLGANGDFAQAYVIAHEVGHHVQKILGISDKASGLRGPSEGANGNSVKLELQADCFAGVWAHFTAQKGILEKGDLEEALTAATAIGDDRLQRQATGTVNPEKFTHGTSAERARWFKRGYDQGTVPACDTFGAPSL